VPAGCSRRCVYETPDLTYQDRGPFSDPRLPGSVVSDAILMAGNSSPILLKS
jgi:hypothetical protein